jgi:amino acid adenylation domain-containing protein
MDKDYCQGQFQAKIYGLLVLERILKERKDNPLDFCLLTSSLSSVLGGLGYAAYSAANNFMDAFVHRNSSEYTNTQPGHTVWLSVNFDAWHFPKPGQPDTTSDSSLRQLAITPGEGTKLFQRILYLRDVKQLVISPGDLQKRIRQWVRLEGVNREPGLPGEETRESTRPLVLLGRPNLSAAYEAPRSPLEQKLTGIWQDFFGIEKIGVHDNFFELGGDSLKGMRLVNHYKKLLGEMVYVGMVFESPTIAEMAAFFTKHYPRGVAAALGVEVETEAYEAVLYPKKRINAAQVMQVRQLISSRAPRGPGTEIDGPGNPPAVFVLSPPRSGSTLLRVMLGGHPRLFAPPELDLLYARNLNEVTGDGEGLIRTLMQIEQCGVEEAKHMLETFKNQQMTSKAFYGLVQQRIGDKILVDKSPLYTYHPEVLKWAEREFENPLYIHLVRHPYGMIRSKEEAKLSLMREETLTRSFTRYQLNELGWIICNQNILEFLDQVPAHRHHRVRFEDLVKKPRAIMKGLCEFLGLEFHPEMLEPYKNKKERMTDGTHPEGIMKGDPKFHEHNKIDPEVADKWKTYFKKDFLGDITWQIAESFGYERLNKSQNESIPVVEKKEYYPQSSAQKRLFFLDHFEDIGTSYNIRMVFKIVGGLDKKSFESAFKALISRHESLRTSFHLLNDEPVQKVHDKVNFEIEYYKLKLPTANCQLPTEFIRPFDLSKAPLLRVGLVPLSQQEHLLLFDMHHIIGDGTSMGILVDDFVSFYEDDEPLLMKVQYKDFACWQNRLFKTGKIKEQEEYWLNLYSPANEIPRLDLPLDFPRPEIFNFEGNRYGFKLENESAIQFQQMGSQNGVTLYMNLLAVFNVLLHKYTGQDDIIVGTGIMGRPHVDLHRMIGMFVNSIGMRNYPTPGKTYIELLEEVKTASVKAFENQDLQFEELVDKLDLVRDPSRNPLFDVVMVVQNFERSGKKIKDKNVILKPYPFENKTSKFDLTLYAFERDDEIHFDLEYCTALFKKETIVRLTTHFVSILRQVSKTPGGQLSQVDLLTVKEKQRLLKDFNQTGSDYPERKTIHELFREQVGRTPDHVAVVGVPLCGVRPTGPIKNNVSITYGLLNERAAQLANYMCLEQAIQIQPGQLTGILIQQSIDRIAAVLGVLKAGAAYVPIDPLLPEERIRYILNDAGAGVVLSQKKYIKALNRLQWECPGFRTFLCMDGWDVHGVEEEEKNELMDKTLWQYVGKTATDDITGGGWVSSYTGEPFSRAEMDEYGDNILEKLTPLLHPEMKVLEIGCASGITMYRIAPLVGHYYGTDLSETIIQVNKKQTEAQGHQNITLSCIPAHDIHNIKENNFDLIIMNSVIQCFHGYNYLRQVIGKTVDLMAERGQLFIGDIMNQQLKGALIDDLKIFKKTHQDKNYKTKTDFSQELFVSPGFFEDLRLEIPGIEKVEFSSKIHRIKNELTRFRYDALITINKVEKRTYTSTAKHKYQQDRSILEKYSWNPSAAPVKEGNPAYVIYTSGTTGVPKGVMVEQGSLVNLCCWHNRNFAVTEQDKATQYAGFGFDASVWEIFPYLIKGAALHLITDEIKLDIPALREYYEKNNITISFLPTQFCEQFFFVEEKEKSENSSLRILLTGGDKLNRFIKKSYDVYNNYGPTENTVVTTSCMIETASDNIPIGKPISNNRIYILNKDMQLQPIEIAGELCIAGDNLARGYVNDPELTARKFDQDLWDENQHKRFAQHIGSPRRGAPGRRRQRIYRTGDFARWLSDGTIEFRGRRDLQVKIRGYRVELGEIETQLLDHTDIKEAVVTVREEKSGGIYLCAYFTSDGEPEISGLKTYLSGSLPNYIIPAYLIQIDRMPLTSSGKINRGVLPLPGDLAVRGEGFVAPRDQVEETLVGIWSEVLGLEKKSIGIDDDFFERGGHSLRATILVSQIHKVLDIKIPLGEIFKAPSIRELAGCVKKSKKSIHEGNKPVEKKDYYPQSSAQKRLFFLDHLEDIGTSYNIPGVSRIKGKMDKGRYENVFKALIARHESLRTSFHLINNEPVQRVHDRVEFEIEYFYLATEGKEGKIGRWEDGKMGTGTHHSSFIIHHFIRPFDLSKVPLLRVGIAEISAREFLLLFDMHHIISDGTSAGIMVDDFIQLYDGKTLNPLEIQYKDFSRWQNNLFETGQIKEQEDYWLNVYSNKHEIPRLNLPTDYPRPLVFNFAGDRYSFKLKDEEVSRLKEMDSENDVTSTLYMILLAVFYVLLHKYTGQEDIIVGSGIAGRPHADLQRIIGMFVNSLAMRNQPTPGKTWREFLNEVKENSIKAFENQDVQFEEFVDKLDPERDPSRNPVFDVLFVVQNFEKSKKELEDKQVGFAPYHSENKTSKFDLTLFAYEGTDEISFSLEYCTALFKKQTIQRLAAHFKRIIKQVTAAPGITIADIDILSEEEKQRLLYDTNNTYSHYPRDKSLDMLFTEQALAVPDQVAVVFEDQGITYGQLQEEAKQLAGYLYFGKGVRPDEPVGLVMDRTIDAVTAILGIIKAGGAYLPIDPSFPEERMKHIINDTQLKVVISRKEYIKILNRLQWECDGLHTFLCINSSDITSEPETEQNQLMGKKLWEYIGETAVDDITGGGWISSYTGKPIPKQEMDEYGENILKKLAPLLHPQMRVLEIGCASGISMYRIAPRVGFYLGTDLSQVIIEKNEKWVKEEGHTNIILNCLPAHDIDKIENHDFDLIIINSVIQCFHGHNYLRQVIGKAIDKLAARGFLFIGDVMDQDLKPNLIKELTAFKHDNRDKDYKTKTDWSAELFVSRSFFEDLAVEMPEILAVEFTDKIRTLENELTKFRYDALFTIDKTREYTDEKGKKHKYQEDVTHLERYSGRQYGYPGEKGISNITPANLAYIMYTSGSTGKPKGVMVEQLNVVRLVKNTNYIEFKEAGRILQTGALEFDASTFEMWGTLLNGTGLYLAGRDTLLVPQALKQAVRKYDIGTMWMTSPLFNRMLQEDIGIFTGLRNLLVGGDVLSPAYIFRLKSHCPQLNVINGYGPTENTTFSTTYLIGAKDEDEETIPIGKPIANSTAYIVDRRYHLQPPGVPGELVVGGDGVSRGYMNDVGLTAEKFDQDLWDYQDYQDERKKMPGKRIYRSYKSYMSYIYRTGDLARWLPDGNIEFLGRIDTQVKIRGYRIELEEIKTQLLKMDNIKEAVVIVQDDPDRDKSLIAYLVLDGDNPGGFDSSEMEVHLARELPDYMIPSYFVPIERIPLTPNGKVDRKKLPHPQMKTGKTVTPPRNKIDEKLVEIWSEVLGIYGTIGIDDNFFELGGHSLKATVLVSRVRKVFNVEFPLSKVFSDPFIRAISEYISNTKKSDYQEIDSAEKREYYPQSSAQKRLFFLDHFENIGSSYNSPYIIKLDGNVDRERFKAVFQALITRYEILRTSFHLIDNQPVQRVHEEVEFEIEFFDLAAGDTESRELRANNCIKTFIRPFDLSNAPLLRVGLIKLEEQAHILVADMHHIITDGTSNTILVADFIRLYEGETLAPPEVQYKDFTRWQNHLIEAGKIKEQEEYWLNIYTNGGEIPKLNMPIDYPRPAVQSFDGDSVQFILVGEDMSGFNRVARSHEATLYMNLLAVFNVLLYKYTGQDDIIVGGVIAGRHHQDLEHIIGMFVNTMAMRSRPNGEKTYREFLQEVKQACVNAYENQDVQFEDLVNKLNLERDLSRNPLFDVSLGVQNFEAPLIETKSELTVSPFKHKNTASLYDLSLDVNEAPNGIRFKLEYCTKLFKEETIQRLIHHFLTIIREVSQNPDTRISRIDMLSKEERRSLLVDFNDTHADYPLNKTVHQLFQEQAKRTPDNIAVVGPLQIKYRTYMTYMTHISYKELNGKSNQLAHVLRLKGVGPDTVVGIMVEPSIEMVAGVLGILKSGGAYLPIDPGTPTQRLLSMLSHSAAPILLTKSQLSANHSFTALQDQLVTRLEPGITSPRERIVDMDRLPMMDRSMIDYNKYNQYIGYAGVKHTITLEATRGCPYNCTYCFKIHSNKQVRHSAENIFAEVKYYYDLGVRRFAFSDDIFNLDIKNSSRFFELVIKNGLNSDIHLFFASGLRGDILTEDYIDLMVEAGTVCVAPALETASPRLQKVIGKNLNLKKFRRNVRYFCEKYPQVISELFTMHGFPTETKEETRQTMDFIKSLKWIHFPYINILRIYPATKMAKFAVKSGIPYESIIRSEDLAWHELPETLPISRSFTLEYQTEFLNEYFLCKERLLDVLPYQMQVMTEDEIVQKYNSYLPVDIDSFSRLLEFTGIKPGELGTRQFLPEESMEVPDLNEKIKNARGMNFQSPGVDALRVLLLDLNLYFSNETNMLYDLVDEPLGLLRLITKLKQKFGSSINGKIAKSRIDFNNYEELKLLLDEFKPEVIGIRTLTFYRDFIHKTISLVRQWGINVPIIVGGPHVTTNYHAVLQDKNIDLAVLGEGEITLVELMEKILENQGKLPGEETLEKIPGLAYIPGKRNQNAHVELAREIIMLDAANAAGGILSDVPENNPPMINQPNNLAYLMFTSGTTGKPKGVLVEHGNVVSLLNWYGPEYRLQSGVHVLQLTDYTFDPTVEDIFGTLVYGGTLHVVDKKIIWDREKFRRYVQLHQVHLIDFVPSGLKELLGGGKLESLRTVICGGERLEKSIKDQIIQWGYRLYNHYGPTEITVDALVSACGPGAVTLGAPVTNVTCYILDRDNMLTPIGVIGELCIGGAGLARGYLNNPELTAEKFDHDLWDLQDYRDGYHRSYRSYKSYILYRTGDLARWLPEGTIEFSGRIDQQVKIRGHRIEPAEIQYFLLKHESINDAIVVPGTRGSNEKYLCAYIVTGTGFDISKLKEYLARQLPEYMIPAYFIQLERIPLTSTGKIDKKQLPPPGTEVGEGKKYVAPKNGQEKQIAAIWKSVLQLKKFSVHDNFFDIGGNSLNIVQVTNRINDIFGKRLSIMVMFKYPTIRSFAEFLLQEEKAGQVTTKKRTEALNRGKRDKKQRYQKRKKQAVTSR